MSWTGGPRNEALHKSRWSLGALLDCVVENMLKLGLLLEIYLWDLFE